ncbi:calcium-binding protein [Geminicoccus flavidas]|uniref:calcium-binding protein n=1 Tax=Geminicoccus flavidas TaxID=2506407 RepID=UPI001357E582|nr:calcium-binding protein [Geminicoccus flavidas]
MALQAADGVRVEAAGGQDPAVPGLELDDDDRPAPRRGERRRRADATLGTPLGAAFVGLLLAQGHQGMFAMPRGEGGGEAGTLAGRGGERGLALQRGEGLAGPVSQGQGHAAAAAVPVLDTGLAVMAGGGALLTGAQGMPALAGTAGGDQIQPLEGLTAIAGISTELTLSPLPSAEIPPVEVDDSDRGGEGLGPVGEHLQGGSGNDVLTGTDRDDVIKGGAGNDVIDGRDGNDDLDGEDGDDVVRGGKGNDVLQGGAGNDLVDGQEGNDIVDGGTGSDVVHGGSGNDLVGGGAGDDVVDGDPGTDIGSGDGGNDRIYVESVRDLAIENREGFDKGGIDTVAIRDTYATSLKAELPNLSPDGLATFVLGDQVGVSLPAGFNPFVQQIHPAIENIDLLGSAAHDVVGGEGANRIQGNEGDNQLWGRGGHDWIDGGDGRDLVWGGTGNDQLHGGRGDDQLHGDAGEDSLHGGAGDDVLDGGAGADLLYGGEGADTYVFGLSEAKPDRVFDFSGSNKINLLDADPDDVQAIVSGPDLYVRVAGKDVAIIDQYLGHEGNWSGILTKGGLKGIASLLTDGTVTPDPTLPQPTPDVVGTTGNDILRAPSDAGHHLRGLGGDDQLFGGAGNDRLDGGAGTDTLQGGAGEDTYLLRHGDGGIDRIIDHQGRSQIQIEGIDFKGLDAWTVGRDLWLAVDTTPLGMVEDWQSNHVDWTIRIGDKTVAADDLFS